MSSALLPGVALLVSDVDGTLVTDDKILPPSAIAAADRLRAAGVAFTIISSRPPRGMKQVARSLGIDAPFAAFNGGAVVGADGVVIEAWRLAPACARSALALLSAHGVDAWVYADDLWMLLRPDGPKVDLERRTIGFGPTQVEDFEGVIGRVDKIVGVSLDGPLLARLEAQARSVLGGEAAVHRSQPYYLDITHPRANKGDAVTSISRLMGIGLERTAVIGDMFNDVAMFERAAYAIAMGQSPPEVKAKAAAVTSSNQEDGFASAVERFILPRARGAAPWR